MVDFNDTLVNAALTTGTSPTPRQGRVQIPAARSISGRALDYRAAGADRDYIAEQLRVADPAYSRVATRPASGRIRITFEVFEEFAPALRSAIEEISNDIGARLTGSHRFAKEQALTDAAVALAPLRVAISAKIPAGDPNYV
jgi:hypothetical protein